MMDLLKITHPYRLVYNNILTTIDNKSMNKDNILVKIPYIYKRNKTDFYNYKHCLCFCLKALRENNFSAYYKKPNYIVIGNLRNRFENLFNYCSSSPKEPKLLLHQFSNLIEERDHHLDLIKIKQKFDRTTNNVYKSNHQFNNLYHLNNSFIAKNDNNNKKEEQYIQKKIKPKTKKKKKTTPSVIIEEDFYKTLGIDNNDDIIIETENELYLGNEAIDMLNDIPFEEKELKKEIKPPKTKKNKKKPKQNNVIIDDICLLNIINKNKKYSL